MTAPAETGAETSLAEADDAPRLEDACRLVVKIGSALLVDEEKARLRTGWLEALCDDMAALKAAGKEIIVVSSGAIALGRHQMGLHRRSIRLEESQAAAATGQIQLAHAYQEALARHGITVAQILLTLADTEERRRHLNARGTLETLLRLGALPVINENDTVATSEIRFGDNDRLGARVAAMMNADALILLSDIDGLYDADPRRDPDARFVPLVDAITPEIEAMAGEVPPGYSSGGMATKLEAAAHRHRRRLPHGDRRRPPGASPGGPRRRARAAPGSWPGSSRSGRANAGSPAPSSPAGSVTPGPRGACGAHATARACCRRASRESRAASSAATPSCCTRPRGPGDRAGPQRLFRRRRRAHHHRPQEP